VYNYWKIRVRSGEFQTTWNSQKDNTGTCLVKFVVDLICQKNKINTVCRYLSLQSVVQLFIISYGYTSWKAMKNKSKQGVEKVHSGYKPIFSSLFYGAFYIMLVKS